MPIKKRASTAAVRTLLSASSKRTDAAAIAPVFPYSAIRSSASNAAARTFPSASSERAGTAALDGIGHMHEKENCRK